jgi:hypothetical protein
VGQHQKLGTRGRQAEIHQFFHLLRLLVAVAEEIGVLAVLQAVLVVLAAERHLLKVLLTL